MNTVLQRDTAFPNSPPPASHRSKLVNFGVKAGVHENGKGFLLCQTVFISFPMYYSIDVNAKTKLHITLSFFEQHSQIF